MTTFKAGKIIAPGGRMLPASGHIYGNSIVIEENGGLFSKHKQLRTQGTAAEPVPVLFLEWDPEL